jgi:hypothetical protein
MGRLVLVLLLSVASSFGQQAKAPTSEPCTVTERELTRATALRIRDWDALYRLYARYGRCEDVDSAEGFSESVARILADHWSTLPRLGRLSDHTEFKHFVLSHIDATLDMKDVRKIRDAAVHSCPRGLRQLCLDIAGQARIAEAEDATDYESEWKERKEREGRKTEVNRK